MYTDIFPICIAGDNVRPQTFVRSTLEPTPPVVALLTMIRLTEDVMVEVQKRGCSPLESYTFGLRLQMWPVFQKAMSEHIESLKKLAEGATSGYFSRTTATTDVLVSSVGISLRSEYTITSNKHALDMSTIYSHI